MSQKRKLDEYHDPDYERVAQGSDGMRVKKFRTNSAGSACPLNDEERLGKWNEIVQREFSAELAAKEAEINEIEKRLVDAKQLLAKIRYAVVYNYYNRKSQLYSTSDLKMDGAATTEDSSAPIDLAEEKGQQPAIHPSLKKLIGKRPLTTMKY